MAFSEQQTSYIIHTGSQTQNQHTILFLDDTSDKFVYDYAVSFDFPVVQLEDIILFPISAS